MKCNRKLIDVQCVRSIIQNNLLSIFLRVRLSRFIIYYITYYILYYLLYIIYVLYIYIYIVIYADINTTYLCKIISISLERVFYGKRMLNGS